MFRSWSIRVQLLALAVASVMPFVAFTMHHIFQHAAETRAAAGKETLERARRVAARLDDHVANVDTLLTATAEAIADHLGDPGAVDRRLRAIHAGLPGYFASLAVLAPDGTMLASATATPSARRGLNFSDRDYFRLAMERRALAIGEPVRSRTSGTWIVIMAKPLLDGEGRVRVLVMAATELERFRQMFAPDGSPEGSIYVVLSRTGVVLARSVQTREPIGSDVSFLPLFRRALELREGIVEGAGMDGHERIGGVSRSTRAPWTVYAGVRTEVALEAAWAEDRTMVLLSLGAGLLAAALALVAARRISSPVLGLSRAVERIASGDLGARAGFETRGELGALGAAFDRMAARLERVAADRRLAEDARRESDEKLRLFVHYAPAAIAMFDREMRYLAYSRRWLSDYRLGDRDLVGRSHYEVFPGLPERWKEIHRRCLAGDTERADDDPFTREDGSTDWVRWEVRPWYAQGGEIGGILMLTEVVTARKLAEDEVLRLNRDLEREVADRTAALQAANTELAAFDAAVSHDLRAPINRIRGFGTALLEDCGAALGESGRDFVRRILRAADRMEQLVEDLLRLATAGREEFARANIDVSDIAGSILQALAEAHPARRVELSITPSLRARADPGLLRSLLENLLGNAWKFTAGRDPGRIEVGAVAAEGETVIFVRDNGAGFDGARASELFTPFRRLHRQEEFAGTGLGLATVKRIVERHGGRVWAEGEVGRGATVYFTLGEATASPAHGPNTVRTASSSDLPSAVFTT